MAQKGQDSTTSLKTETPSPVQNLGVTSKEIICPRCHQRFTAFVTVGSNGQMVSSSIEAECPNCQQGFDPANPAGALQLYLV